MPSRQDRLIHWLLGSLDLQTTLFHLGQYCGSWQASTSGLARAGFHLILDGECWLHLPQQAARQKLEAGDALFFLRDTPHVLSPNEQPERAAGAPRVAMQPIAPPVAGGVALACGFFEFRARLGDTLLASFPDHVVIRRDGGELAELRPLFDLVLAEARAGGAGPSPLIARLVDLMFFYVVRHLCRRNEVSAGLWAVLARPEFAPLLEAVVAEPGRDWDVGTMAGLSRMSRATFFKRFAQTAGTSPAQFVAQVRMQVATQLIGHGMSLSRAAEQVGYQSDAAFSRAFKKITGTLPGAFRRAAAARPDGETFEQERPTFAH